MLFMFIVSNEFAIFQLAWSPLEWRSCIVTMLYSDELDFRISFRRNRSATMHAKQCRLFMWVSSLALISCCVCRCVAFYDDFMAMKCPPGPRSDKFRLELFFSTSKIAAKKVNIVNCKIFFFLALTLSATTPVLSFIFSVNCALYSTQHFSSNYRTMLEKMPWRAICSHFFSNLFENMHENSV